MKSCNYWNYNSSLPTIVDKGKKMCPKSSLEHNQQSPVNLPRTVDVCETEGNLDNLSKSEELLTDSLQSKSILENEIIHNYRECTRLCKVVPLNPQKDQNICIPPCFIMKETRPQFSTLKT